MKKGKEKKKGNCVSLLSVNLRFLVKNFINKKTIDKIENEHN